MSSSRPYLIRALNQWIADDGNTSHIVVRVDGDHVRVPTQFVRDGQITLNISPTAVRNLDVDNHYVRFSARFGASPMAVEVPTMNVLAIYAKETGEGMVFGQEPGSPDDPEDDRKADDAARPSLRVVK